MTPKKRNQPRRQATRTHEPEEEEKPHVEPVSEELEPGTEAEADEMQLFNDLELEDLASPPSRVLASWVRSPCKSRSMPAHVHTRSPPPKGKAAGAAATPPPKRASENVMSSASNRRSVRGRTLSPWKGDGSESLRAVASPSPARKPASGVVHTGSNPPPPPMGEPEPLFKAPAALRTKSGAAGAKGAGGSGGGSGAVAHNANGCKRCTCKRSRCLKLYCDCFAAGQFCTGCNCVDCLNREENMEEVMEARTKILSRSPTAFEPKAIATSDGAGGSEAVHRKGCRCKRSHCLKKYCECFQAGLKCSEHCKCVGCENQGPPGGCGDKGAAESAGAEAAAAAAASKSGVDEDTAMLDLRDLPLTLDSPLRVSLGHGSLSPRPLPSPLRGKSRRESVATINADDLTFPTPQPLDALGVGKVDRVRSGRASSLRSPTFSAGRAEQDNVHCSSKTGGAARRASFPLESQRANRPPPPTFSSSQRNARSMYAAARTPETPTTAGLRSRSAAAAARRRSVGSTVAGGDDADGLPPLAEHPTSINGNGKCRPPAATPTPERGRRAAGDRTPGSARASTAPRRTSSPEAASSAAAWDGFHDHHYAAREPHSALDPPSSPLTKGYTSSGRSCPSTPCSPITRSMAAMLGAQPDAVSPACFGDGNESRRSSLSASTARQLRAGTYILGQHYGTTKLEVRKFRTPRKSSRARPMEEESSDREEASPSDHEATEHGGPMAHMRVLLSPSGYTLRNRSNPPSNPIGGAWDPLDDAAVGSKQADHRTPSNARRGGGGGETSTGHSSDPPAPPTRELVQPSRGKRFLRDDDTEEDRSPMATPPRPLLDDTADLGRAGTLHQSPPHSPTHSTGLVSESLMMMASPASLDNVFMSPIQLLNTPSSRRRLVASPIRPSLPRAKKNAMFGHTRNLSAGRMDHLQPMDFINSPLGADPVGAGAGSSGKLTPSMRLRSPLSKKLEATMDELVDMRSPQSPPSKRPRLRRALGYNAIEQVPITPDQNSMP